MQRNFLTFCFLLSIFVVLFSEAAEIKRKKRWIQNTGFGRDDRGADVYLDDNADGDDDNSGIEKRSAPTYQYPKDKYGESELFGRFPGDDDFDVGVGVDQDIGESGGANIGGDKYPSESGGQDPYQKENEVDYYPTTSKPSYPPWLHKIKKVGQKAGRFLQDKFNYFTNKIRNLRDIDADDEGNGDDYFGA